MPKKEEESPKITVITPSFNQAKYIEQTIRSVVEQDYPNIEYLIMDGGSTDGSVEIIKKYAKKYPNIIKWQSKKDGGQVNAINEGLKKATGDIIAYLNSDDYYLPGVFKKVESSFQRGGNWVVGDFEIKSENKKWFYKVISFYSKLIREFHSKSLLLILNYFPQPSVFWKKVSNLYFSNQYKFAFDYEYWLKLQSKYGNPFVLNEALSVFRIHRSSKGSLGFVEQFDEEYKAACKHTNNIFIKVLHFFHAKILVIFIYKIFR